jgi:hypothetical protein
VQVNAGRQLLQLVTGNNPDNSANLIANLHRFLVEQGKAGGPTLQVNFSWHFIFTLMVFFLLILCTMNSGS